jgi:subtilisin family serine protease
MFSFKYGGKRGKTIRLKESQDKIVVRTKGNKRIDDANLGKSSRDLMANTNEVMSFPDAGISVRQVDSSSASGAVVLRDEARTTLKQDDNVRFAGRVLEDASTGEVMLYTENFFLKFKSGTTEAKCLSIIALYGLTVKMKLPFAENSWFVQAPEGTGLKTFEIAEKLLAEKDIEFCHPEMVQERRNKDLNALQWHLAPTKINGTAVNAHVNILEAWKITKGKGITIAIVDDGVDTDHPEFKGKVVHPRDVTLNIDDARPKEKDDNHGTPCAGVALASGLEINGTAPEAMLMPIRLRNGLGSMAEAQAFAWAADHGADVISCSWGPADGRWWDPEDPTHQRNTMLPDSTRLAIDYAMTKGRKGRGCVVLFAAGNGNEGTETDGYVSYPPVIAVAACNDTGKRSVYSDFGKAVWVAFPSRDFGWKPFKHPNPISTGIHTTDRLKEGGYTTTDYYDAFGGTSSACPGMAGVVGLMLAANPDLTPPLVKELIKNNCERVDSTDGEYDASGHSDYYGYGRIDAGKVVAAAKKAQKASSNTGAELIEGFVRFAKSGDIPFRSGELYKHKPADKIIGFSFAIKADGVQLESQLHLSSLGLLKSGGAYIGATNARRSIYGIGFTLTGPNAHLYSLRFDTFAANGASKTGSSGSFIGVKIGKIKPFNGFSLSLVKK